MSLGFDLAGLGVFLAVTSREALDLEILQVLVLAVVAEPEESFLEARSLITGDAWVFARHPS